MKNTNKRAEGKTKYWSRSPGLYVDSNTGVEIKRPVFAGNIQMWYDTLADLVKEIAEEADGPGFILASQDPYLILEHVHNFKSIYKHDFLNEGKLVLSHGEMDLRESILDPDFKVCVHLDEEVPPDMVHFVLEDGACIPIQILNGRLGTSTPTNSSGHESTEATKEQNVLARASNCEKVTVQFMKLNSLAVIPTYETEGSAGMDLRSTGFYNIPCGFHCVVDTGLAISIPRGFEGQIRPRSGLAANHGVTVLNSPGTIDSDYRGELKIILVNHGNRQAFDIKPGDRIAQMVIAPVIQPFIEVVETLDETLRGVGGLGSTGTT